MIRVGVDVGEDHGDGDTVFFDGPASVGGCGWAELF